MRMKKWLYTLLVVVLAACSNEIPEQQPAKRSGRTVLAYLVSNSPNSLEINLQNNVVDMYTALAGSKDSCTLLVFYRPQKISEFFWTYLHCCALTQTDAETSMVLRHCLEAISLLKVCVRQLE